MSRTMSRSELYHEAKVLGWTTIWNKSKSTDLRQYIDEVRKEKTTEEIQRVVADSVESVTYYATEVKNRYYENKKKKIKKKIRKRYKNEKFTFTTNPVTGYTEI